MYESGTQIHDQRLLNLIHGMRMEDPSMALTPSDIAVRLGMTFPDRTPDPVNVARITALLKRS